MLVNIKPQITPQIIELLAESVYKNSLEHATKKAEEYRASTNLSLYAWMEKSEIIGICGFKVYHTDKLELLHIAVAKKARNQGIGRKIISALKNEYLLPIHAQTDDDAIGFYRKQGFQTAEIIKPPQPETPVHQPASAHQSTPVLQPTPTHQSASTHQSTPTHQSTSTHQPTPTLQPTPRRWQCILPPPITYGPIQGIAPSKITISYNPEINPDQLWQFYVRNSICEAGYGKEQAVLPLKHNPHLVAAFYEDKLVGIIRAMFDGLTADIREACLEITLQGENLKHDNGSLIENDPHGIFKQMGLHLQDQLSKQGNTFITSYIVENCEEEPYKSIGMELNTGHLAYYKDTRAYVQEYEQAAPQS